MLLMTGPVSSSYTTTTPNLLVVVKIVTPAYINNQVRFSCFGSGVSVPWQYANPTNGVAYFYLNVNPYSGTPTISTSAAVLGSNVSTSGIYTLASYGSPNRLFITVQ